MGSTQAAPSPRRTGAACYQKWPASRSSVHNDLEFLELSCDVFSTDICIIYLQSERDHLLICFVTYGRRYIQSRIFALEQLWGVFGSFVSNGGVFRPQTPALQCEQKVTWFLCRSASLTANSSMTRPSPRVCTATKADARTTRCTLALSTVGSARR